MTTTRRRGARRGRERVVEGTQRGPGPVTSEAGVPPVKVGGPSPQGPQTREESVYSPSGGMCDYPGPRNRDKIEEKGDFSTDGSGTRPLEI